MVRPWAGFAGTMSMPAPDMSSGERLEADEGDDNQNAAVPTLHAEPPSSDRNSVRVDFDLHAPTFARAMAQLDRAATNELDRSSVDPRLRELIRVRASQLNGCAYCIDMHTKDARAIGETEQRLYALQVWRETSFFTDRERAALGFTESVTLLAADHVPATAYAAVAAQFNADEIAALIALIVTINAWNALGVSTRAWVPGSYKRPTETASPTDPAT